MVEVLGFIRSDTQQFMTIKEYTTLVHELCMWFAEKFHWSDPLANEVYEQVTIHGIYY